MAKNFKLSRQAVDAALDAMLSRLDGGTLRLYTGPQPETSDAPLAGQALLAELPFGTPAFEPAEDGVAFADNIVPEDAAVGTGTATWFRAYTFLDEPMFDGSVGEAEADLVMNSVRIQRGTIVDVTSFSVTQPKQG